MTSRSYGRVDVNFVTEKSLSIKKGDKRGEKYVTAFMNDPLFYKRMSRSVLFCLYK